MPSKRPIVLPPQAHDAGGGRVMRLLPGVQGAAMYQGKNKEYRILLTRDWSRKEPWTAPYALFIGMNPSMAEEDIDDPTVRREQIDTQRELGLSRYVKANVCSYRLTDPKKLKFIKQPLHIPENFEVICKMASEAEIVVLSFGRVPKDLLQMRDDLLLQLSVINKQLFSYGHNQDGSPPHPRFIKPRTPITLWKGLK